MPKKRKKKGSGVDSLKKQQMAANYGFALAFMKSDPELWKLFNTAVKKTWDANMFVARLRSTKWFKRNSASVRNAIMQETADPATYRANISKMSRTLADAWGSRYGTRVEGKWINYWSKMAFRMGWSEAEALDHMSRNVDYDKALRRRDLGGTAAELRGQLEAAETQYGLSMGNNWKAKKLEELVEGRNTIQGVTDSLREWARQEYAAFAAELDSGKTIMEIADPYRQQMAELLEINPADISIRDQMLQRALKSKDKEGRPAALSMTDFANTVRKDSRWQYTNNAKKDAANVTAQLLQSFGLMEG
jgi:hypothetical protein